jgi:hypothetical protein
LDGLLNEKLLTAESMTQMKQWVNNSKGEPTYGLGLDYTKDMGNIAWGHAGGDLVRVVFSFTILKKTLLCF